MSIKGDGQLTAYYALGWESGSAVDLARARPYVLTITKHQCRHTDKMSNLNNSAAWIKPFKDLV